MHRIMMIFFMPGSSVFLSITLLLALNLLMPPAVAHSIVDPKMAAGSSHTIALKNDGTVWAWGFSSGQLN